MSSRRLVTSPLCCQSPLRQGDELHQRVQAEVQEEHQRECASGPPSVRCPSRAMRNLSSSANSSLDVDQSSDGVDPNPSVAPAKLDELVIDSFKQTTTAVDRVMQGAKLDTGAIHEVVLVGRSTYFPMVVQLLKEFNGKEPNKSNNWRDRCIRCCCPGGHHCW